MIGSSGKAASPLIFWWLFVLVHGFEEPLAAGGAQQTVLVQAFDANLSRAIPSFNAPLGTVIENHDYVRTLRLGGPIPHSGSAGLWQWCNLQQHGGSLDADLSRVIMRCVVQVLCINSISDG